MDQWDQNVKVKAELLGAFRYPGEIQLHEFTPSFCSRSAWAQAASNALCSY